MRGAAEAAVDWRLSNEATVGVLSSRDEDDRL